MGQVFVNLVQIVNLLAKELNLSESLTNEEGDKIIDLLSRIPRENDRKFSANLFSSPLFTEIQKSDLSLAGKIILAVCLPETCEKSGLANSLSLQTAYLNTALTQPLIPEDSESILPPEACLLLAKQHVLPRVNLKDELWVGNRFGGHSDMALLQKTLNHFPESVRLEAVRCIIQDDKKQDNYDEKKILEFWKMIPKILPPAQKKDFILKDVLPSDQWKRFILPRRGKRGAWDQLLPAWLEGLDSEDQEELYAKLCEDSAYYAVACTQENVPERQNAPGFENSNGGLLEIWAKAAQTDKQRFRYMLQGQEPLIDSCETDDDSNTLGSLVENPGGQQEGMLSLVRLFSFAANDDTAPNEVRRYACEKLTEIQGLQTEQDKLIKEQQNYLNKLGESLTDFEAQALDKKLP